MLKADKFTDTTPSSEPVSLAEARAHLRLSSHDDDVYVLSLISAARDYVERRVQQAYVPRTRVVKLDQFNDDIWLPGPVSSITHIKYYNTDSPSVLTTLAASQYQLFQDRVLRVQGGTYPSVYPRPDTVQITYTAGIASTSSPQWTESDIPPSIKAAILLLVAGWYEYREDRIVGNIVTENATVDRLLNLHREYR